MTPTRSDPAAADSKLIENERRKLTAGYLNTFATTILAAGVVVPATAVFYDLTTKPLALPSLAVGAAYWIAISIGIHSAARRILRGLRS